MPENRREENRPPHFSIDLLKKRWLCRQRSIISHPESGRVPEFSIHDKRTGF